MAQRKQYFRRVHPHSKLSADGLRKIKIRNRKICHIDGLPNDITEDVLRCENWYGRFEGILRVNIKKTRHTYDTSAWLTFTTEKSANDAIEFTNNCEFDDDRILKATMGWNAYCKAFIRNQECTRSQCPNYHQYICDISDVIPPQIMSAYFERQSGLPPTRRSNNRYRSRQRQAIQQRQVTQEEKKEPVFRLSEYKYI